MARRDALTNVGPMSGNNRPNSLKATKRKFNVNLQKVVIKNENGQKITLKVSAKTKKTLRKLGHI
ncbi:50S ribosomal protein L28 [Mesomycoplasma bovoculi]|uniref:Large ribosomal subunit protein bL28 n=1 Tax=Mesomycoplasma bovoculi M165/69 TaxID=743966 RepID=W5V015_9BACT|nr:50S ribosomal protein L28 [Mesomycoplasma bovoculi]AHH45138.1 50S ribosomal protein L28 [Mesomycoplasma bovoculi M165/69]